MTVGQAIRAKRTKRKLHLHQVAAACGIAVSTLSRYETDKIDPQTHVLAKLAEVLGCGVRDLLPPRRAA